MSKQEENRNDIEENPTDKILEKMEQDKQKIKKSAVLAFAALIAIIALGIAWFVSSTKVTGTSSSVSADEDNPFWLASVGSRQDVEKGYLKDENNQNILYEGTVKKYSSYIDTKTGNEVKTGETDYHVGTSSLAWYLNGQESLAPGANGKLEFYIIPKKDGLKSVSIALEVNGYTSERNRAVVSSDSTLQNLLNGHILFFKQVDDTYGYQGWIQPNQANQTFVVNAPGDGTFTVNVPYKVTIYWVWPQYFRNYIYTQRSTQGDLFTDATDQGKDSDYAQIVKFADEQRTVPSGTNKLFYDSQNITISNTINKNMLQATLDACSKYYNQADEYIGTNGKYVYVGIKVN